MTRTSNQMLPDPAVAADHGGGIDAAVIRYGGPRENWIDLSTGINPQPYPIPGLGAEQWTQLPDSRATERLEQAARQFWQVPDDADVLAAPGASALIARIPDLHTAGTVAIPGPTYNEHARAFFAAGWQVGQGSADAQVLVHPNNPDGRIWRQADVHPGLAIIDESFCDVMPDTSLVALGARPGALILKSFGKFWGLAGLRLGFVIGDGDLVGRLRGMIGPWPVSGPALAIGAAALLDIEWAARSRSRLTEDAGLLDSLIQRHGAKLVGGCDLFRLYDVGSARQWQDHLAKHHIWTRVFPYNQRWLRLGLPGTPDQWTRLTAALKDWA